MKLNNAIEVSEINSEYITLINKATGLPVIINKEALAKALRSYRKVYIRDLENNADDLLIDGVYTYYNITNVPYTSGILRVSSNMYTISSGKESNSLCRKLGVETRVNLDTSTDFMQLTQEFGQIGYRGITSSLLTV